MDQRQQRILTQSALGAGVALALGLVGLGLAADQQPQPIAAQPPAVAAGEVPAPSGTGSARGALSGSADRSSLAAKAPEVRIGVNQVESPRTDLPIDRTEHRDDDPRDEQEDGDHGDDRDREARLHR